MSRTTDVINLKLAAQVQFVEWTGLSSGFCNLGDIIVLHLTESDKNAIALAISVDDAKALHEGLNKMLFALKRDEN